MGFYVVCDDDSRHESMTKEQILTAITQAIENGSIGNIDTGFVTRLKEQNSGGAVTIWVGTMAQYNALTQKAANCLYIITDDTTGDDIINACEQALGASAQAMSTSAQAMSTAEKAQAIDVSDNLSFALRVSASTTANISSEIYFRQKKFSYVPSLGIVFFNFSISFKDVVTYDRIIYKQIGGYMRDMTQFTYIQIQSSDKRFYAKFTPEGFLVDVLENVEGTNIIAFSGWYFCNGGL